MKTAILAYVARVTAVDAPDFIPPPERIAVFDNDGTLWPENPIPFQAAFIKDRLKEGIREHPGWLLEPAVQSAIKMDIPALVADGHRGLLRLVALTHSGMTTEAFTDRVNRWMHTARHPRWNRPYDACIFQPMLELLRYLRAHGFKTFIVSGGGADFIRVWSERVYGIPPEQVVGSHGKVSFEVRDGEAIFHKSMDGIFVDDREGKPVGIHQFIGRRPVLAFGNSDGDKAMLEYTTLGNPHPSLGLILHHTDAEREYAYDAEPRSTGKLVEALAEAPERGWVVVDMARDWETVLIPDPAATGG
ncbi:MAG TPA: HAD family hydrolase [Longimicrobiales bacterium]|nr:HAD family hydrolase [Longimicrobiales bacterium]